MAQATREAFGEAITDLGEKTPELVVLDADLSKSTMTQAFAKKFPERHFELGIAEQNMIGVGAGLALCGKIPVATSFACFLVGRLEPIRIAVAYNRTNVKLVGTHAGLAIGEDGTSQMGLEDLGALRSLPNIVILQPGDALETKQAVAWMIQHDGPVYIRLTRQKVEDCHAPSYRFEPGRVDVVWEPAAKPSHYQATIFASGGTVGPAIAAAKDLEKRGFASRVANVGTIKPFDEDAAVRFSKDSSRFVSVEDHNVFGGLDSALCEAVAQKGLSIPVVLLGAHAFGESGKPDELYEKYGISAPHIVEACLKNLN